MSSTIYPRTIIRGCSYSITVACKSDGVAQDMTGKTLVARFRKVGASDVSFTRDSDTASEFTWTDQSAGTGHWDWASNETITLGEYVVEFYQKDTSSPVIRKFYGTTRYVFRQPETGAF